jgi:hypothetical protein
VLSGRFAVMINKKKAMVIRIRSGWKNTNDSKITGLINFRGVLKPSRNDLKIFFNIC